MFTIKKVILLHFYSSLTRNSHGHNCENNSCAKSGDWVKPPQSNMTCKFRSSNIAGKGLFLGHNSFSLRPTIIGYLNCEYATTLDTDDIGNNK